MYTDSRSETCPACEPTLVPTWHKQQRRYLSKNTKEDGAFLQRRGAAPCTENKIYFPLLLLYVESGHFQSSELLQTLFLSGGPRFIFLSQTLIHMPVAMWLSFSPLLSCLHLVYLHFYNINFLSCASSFLNSWCIISLSDDKNTEFIHVLIILLCF